MDDDGKAFWKFYFFAAMGACAFLIGAAFALWWICYHVRVV